MDSFSLCFLAKRKTFHRIFLRCCHVPHWKTVWNIFVRVFSKNKQHFGESYVNMWHSLKHWDQIISRKSISLKKCKTENKFLTMLQSRHSVITTKLWRIFGQKTLSMFIFARRHHYRCPRRVSSFLFHHGFILICSLVYFSAKRIHISVYFSTVLTFFRLICSRFGDKNKTK